VFPRGEHSVYKLFVSSVFVVVVARHSPAPSSLSVSHR
jgi:hypothetical protein